MNINTALIERLEMLARLELSEEEREGLRHDLNAILEMVDKLRELDTEGVEPLSHLGDTVNAFREDVVSGQVDRHEALRNAPDNDGRFFRVPKVIDK